MNPIFPVVVDYGDNSYELFKTFEDFLEESGCEEITWESERVIIVDSRRRCFKLIFKRKDKRFIPLGIEPTDRALQEFNQIV